MSLKGQTAVITGSGRGLGRAVALAMANADARIALFSRTGSELKEVAETIQKSGGAALAVTGDVSKKTDVTRLFERTAERFGPVRILVNNAAVIGPADFLENSEPDAWQSTIDINLTGAYYCCRRAIPQMMDSGGGRIISITSGLSRMPFPHFSAYAVSKAGIEQLTRSLSAEFKEQAILVNAVDPGVMDTPMQETIRDLGPNTLREDIHRRFVGFKESGELNDPEEIARGIARLAASESGITGEILSRKDLDQWP
ncbi:MAG: SDR family NAD(P)-dependent oxidoreductase [Thermodesulfobacteriota bacterium]